MELKKLIENYTHFITDENQNKWEVIETSDLDEILELFSQKTKDIVKRIKYRVKNHKNAITI